ncbi:MULTISPECIES: hypothetical protein [Actinokineospora]|uniref:hypothetical protein n=1 Tax=Actinokineospora TaxID=39845 RepID=UPI001670B944|nr:MULTISPECIES: hypothetical protein [Actinokineospora]
MTDDPERLLAEALRAQAAQAPVAHQPEPALLSGTDLFPRPVEVTERLPPESTPALWVLAVALLLGLAAGAVVGLLTLV